MFEEFTRPPEGGSELAALLERSGVDYRREGNRFRFLFTSRGCRWQVVCDGQEGLVLVYSLHPARITDAERAAVLCSKLNRRLVEGSFFVQEDRFVLRTGCRLIEAVDAQERIARTLEYNAAVMVANWERLSAGSHEPESNRTAVFG